MTIPAWWRSSARKDSVRLSPLASSRVGPFLPALSSDDKLARAKQLGANHGIHYKTGPDWEKLRWKLPEAAASIAWSRSVAPT